MLSSMQVGCWLDRHPPMGMQVSAVYFGTPTIVNNAPLFEPPRTAPLSGKWDKESTLGTERNVCEAARNRNMRIVSGLGSGDITVADRLLVMGSGSEVVAYKHFGGFKDWVMVREP